MTDETKKLFDAPWAIEEEAPLVWYCVIDSKDSVVANDVRDQKTVNRLARLPELYDALMEATKEHCKKCMGMDYRVLLAIPFDYDVIEKGCPVLVDVKAEAHCPAARWIELIKKVRDGE